MAHSVARIPIHLIFSTKDRYPFLTNQGLREELFRYVATILKNNVDSPAIQIGGIEDHIHILLSLSRKFPVMKIVEEAKKISSKWLKSKSPKLDGFSWQAGYAAFGVSESNVEMVRNYIRNQEEHHKKISYQDEFRKLCTKHNVKIDERYSWD